MKVVIFKSYKKRLDVYGNYGDDYTEVWHNLKSIEVTKEISEDEYATLLKAIGYFNNKKNAEYSLEVVIIAEDEEMNELLSDFKKYEKVEKEKENRVRLAQEAKALANKEKLEATKKEKAIKKLAKELNLSSEEVSKMLDKK